MAESPASDRIHDLMSEINGVKSQWEALMDRVSQGYGDAYKNHKAALDTVRRKRKAVEDASREALLFMFSVTSVGFAGGAVGSLFAPWTKKATDQVVEFAFREGIRGMASETSKKTTAAAVQKLFSGTFSNAGDDPFDPKAPNPWDQYLDQKTKLDTCFALVNEQLQRLIGISNEQQWSQSIGQDILDGWRRLCPLLADAPSTGALPERLDVARAAEILMWVAWAVERDWEWWNEQYDYITFLFTASTTNLYERDSDLMDAVHAVKYADELRPVLDRVNVLIGGYASIFIPEKWRRKFPSGYYASEIIDLRMFKYLPVNSFVPAIADVINNFQNTDIPSVLTLMDKYKMNLSGPLLNGTIDLKPYFKRKTL